MGRVIEFISNNFIEVIVTCLLAPLLFELLKIIVTGLYFKCLEKGHQFTISGFWWASVTEVDKNNNLCLGNELLRIKQKGCKVYFTLYQTAEEDRFHVYEGTGYIRGNKLVLAYQEIKKDSSNHIGTFSLRLNNEEEHSPSFVGVYVEARNESFQTFPYTLKQYKMTLKNRILFLIQSKEKFMRSVKFANGCK